MATLTFDPTTVRFTEPDTYVSMENIEHVISWHGLSDNKWHTQVVFKPGMGNTVCSCQGKISESDNRY